MKTTDRIQVLKNMIKEAFPVAIATSLLAALTPALSMAAEDPVAHFRTHISPILEENCFRCHGPEKQKSDLRIDVLDPDLVNGKDGGKWNEILDVLDLGEMPPEDEEQHPDAGQRDAVIGWLESELKRAAGRRTSPDRNPQGPFSHQPRSGQRRQNALEP